MTTVVIPSAARNPHRPEGGLLFPVPRSRFPLAKRLMLRGVLALGIAALAAGSWIVRPIPPSMLARDGALGLTIEDRHGIALRSTRAADGSDARWVAYDRIDPDLINAFVAVEDKRFWEHHGIDVLAAGRALRMNMRAGKTVSGASTITMQLARILRPAERSWSGKLTQAFWALRLETHLSKQQIMEQYLNRVQLGQGTVGVGAATALYFGASASELSIAQAATLAGLAHAPSRDNPHVSPVRARRRQAVALERMRRLGFATRDDVARAREESLASAGRVAPFVAPHFTTRILAWAGADTALGDRVRTSLDIELQRELEAEVRHTVDVLHDRNVDQAAAVVLDNESGEVLAWVGSPDFWAAKDGQTDMVVSARQPGSALKPFLYGVALDRGYTAASVLPDIPKTYATSTGPYQPRNYDRRFRGPTRVREALASSYNVPAVERRIVVRRQCAAPDAASRRLRVVAAGRRVLRAWSRAGQRRRDADRARERISRARERWRMAAVDVAPDEWRRPPGQRAWSAAGHLARGERDRPRHPERSRRAHSGVRNDDAVRFSISRRGEDRHEPPFHGQLGRGNDARVHGGGVGRQLQRPSDGGRERRHRRGPVAASRRHGRVAPRSARRPDDTGRSRSCEHAGLPSLGTTCDAGVRTAHRVVRAGHCTGP